MIDRRERIGDPEEMLRIAMSGNRAGIWTALPGIIVSFDASTMTCKVQPAISALATDATGDRKELALPVLLDCPVVFPGGGGCTLTFPINPGDECLVVFASRCIDSWWQLGGVQGQAELRMHDLSDGFVIPGPRSQPRKFDVSTTAAQLRTDDGNAFVEINPTSHKIKAQTDGELEAVANSATVTAPSISLVGNVSINGNLSVSGNLTNAGTNVGKTHMHSGVQTGSGNTGQPI